MSLPINIKDLIQGHSVEWERIEFKRGFDDRINQEATIDDLDLGLIQAYLHEHYFKRALHHQLCDALRFIKTNIIHESVIYGNATDKFEVFGNHQR